MKKKFIGFIVIIIVICICGVGLVGCNKKASEATFSEDEKVKIEKIEKIDNDTTVVSFGKMVDLNTIVLRENSDKVELFEIYYDRNGEWVMIYRQDRIDNYRLCSVKTVQTDKIKIRILKKIAKTKIDKIEVYNAKKSEQNFRVSSYFVWDGIAENKTNPGFTGYFNTLTDVIMIGKLSLNKDAVVTYGSENEAYTETEFEKDLEALRVAIGKNNVKIRISMNINQEGGNSAIAEFINNKIDSITKTLVEFTKKYNIDGIDYDWEGPQNGKQWKAYNMLIINTADALNAINKTVTVALPPWGANLNKTAIEKVEFVNLMSYDLFDNRGDHASIFETTVDSIKKVIAANIPKEKIMLGLSFYGRTVNKSNDAWPDFKACGEALGQWGNIVENYEYKNKRGQFEYSKGYINGFAMNRDKTAFAIESNLGGVMIFRSQCDMSYSNKFSLHKAVEQAIEERILNFKK